MMLTLHSRCAVNARLRPTRLQSSGLGNAAADAGLFDAWYQPSCPPIARTMGPVKAAAIEGKTPRPCTGVSRHAQTGLLGHEAFRWIVSGHPCSSQLHCACLATAGKGRGVVATRDLATGDLIMACEPLAVLRGADGQRPEAEALVDLVLGSGRYQSRWGGTWQDGVSMASLAQHGSAPPFLLFRWFSEFLYDGSPASVRNVPDFSQIMHEDPSLISGSSGATESVAPASNDATVSKTSVQQKLAKRLSKKGGGSATSGFGAKVKGMASKSSSPEFPGGVDRATARRIAKAVKWVLALARARTSCCAAPPY